MEEITNIRQLNESKYLSAGVEVPEDETIVVTIRNIEVHELQGQTGPQRKGILFFEEEPKGLVLNVTNTNTIGKLHGDNPQLWRGKKIALFATYVDVKGDMKLGIRVKPRIPGEPQQRPPQRQQPTQGYDEAKARVTSGKQPQSNAEMLDDDLPF